MKANSDKSHLIMSCIEVTNAVIDGLPIASSRTEVLLGITIDHVNYLCKKASLKLNALALIARFMNVSKNRIIWILHSRGLNIKIKHIHERALRITYYDKSSSYSELLTKDKSVTIHHRNMSFGSRNLKSHTRTEKTLPLRKVKEAQVAVNRESGRKR